MSTKDPFYNSKGLQVCLQHFMLSGSACMTQRHLPRAQT
jgi:hypothetical protein